MKRKLKTYIIRETAEYHVRARSAREAGDIYLCGLNVARVTEREVLTDDYEPTVGEEIL